MQPREGARRRLAGTFLLDSPHETPADVVGALGAVQAQDYPGAKWAVAQRTPGVTSADLDRALADGTIVRTHVLRPTWHFVLPSDIRWMLALTGGRILAGLGARHRFLEVDSALRRRANRLLEKALRDGNHLTRDEIADLFTRGGIDLTERQRLGHLLLIAELEGLICSGPVRGKQFTWALFDERVPPSTMPSRDEAVTELVRRYYTTHGPATVHDFAWWSGLTTADAKRGLEALGASVEKTTIDGRVYWFAPGPAPARSASSLAHLLPNYDEYFIGHKDRSAILEQAEGAGVRHLALGLTAYPILVDGQVVGGWKRSVRGEAVVVGLELLLDVGDRARRAIAAQVKRYGDFLGVAATIA